MNLMDENSNIKDWREFSVNRSTRFSYLVERFCHTKGNEQKEAIFATVKEFMVYAALIGYEFNKYVPIPNTDSKTKITLGTYASTNHDAYIYLLGLTKEPNVELLSNDNIKNAILHFEAFCNGGLKIIDEWIIAGNAEGLGTNTLFNQAFEYSTREHCETAIS